MKLFKEIKKIGYKHYTEHTVEELDNLPLKSQKRTMEQSLVFRWFREKYEAYYTIEGSNRYGFAFCIYSENDDIVEGVSLVHTTYEEAELECLKKLIEIVKNK